MSEKQKLLLLVGAFLFAYWLPMDHPRVQGAVVEGFAMLGDYAREHVLLCLVPALFIAGAVSVFVRQDAVMRYLGAGAPKTMAYGVASVSGAILAVCSCTVLPLFAGIFKRGAGLGPAVAFLYSGPGINILAIAMTARVLGPDLGVARAVGAISFSLIAGLLMAMIFRSSEEKRQEVFADAEVGELPRQLWQEIVYFGAMIGFLIFANWAKPMGDMGLAMAVYQVKWWLSGGFLALTLYTSFAWFSTEERKEWLESTWTFTKQIIPLLLGGVLLAGFLLGRPSLDAGIIPDHYIADLVGGNSLGANFFAAISGAFMYFATLTEVPILQGLIGSGMGKGPALSLLLAGPALSLPSMIVLRQIMGTKMMVTYVSIVVALSTIVGYVFGMM
ncbi:MAG: permease [Anaeromusa sp.]|uniref:permease n=1 Tax=Anaeromusa sp. TaxID=1872520 RepID=UPI002B21875C|nr:permease [Anaeromusa sp.]MEA4836149.1 permease [Anaeromusa sp.]